MCDHHDRDEHRHLPQGDQQADREPCGVRYGDVPHVQERSENHDKFIAILIMIIIVTIFIASMIFITIVIIVKSFKRNRLISIC